MFITRIQGAYVLKGYPKMLIDLAKKEGLSFPDLKMYAIAGQPFTDVFRSEIIEYLNAVPMVSLICCL